MVEKRICAFTGHRPEALPWRNDETDPRCVDAKERLRGAVDRAYEDGFRHFVCGMARGADFYFAETVLELRTRHPEVILEAAVPFSGQSEGWPLRDQARYRRLLERCDMETLIQSNYDAHCMHRRNAYMVEHASRVIALFNGDPTGGGTLFTLSYALECKVPVEILDI